MKRILVGVDGSPPSHKALRVAIQLAKATGARLTLAFVGQPPVLPPETYRELLGKIESEHRRYASEALSAAQAIAREGGVEAEGLPLYGAPAEALCNAANSENSDLIVVGSRGLGAVKRAFVGSVSDRVAHIANRPVLVVP